MDSRGYLLFAPGDEPLAIQLKIIVSERPGGAQFAGYDTVEAASTLVGYDFACRIREREARGR